MLGIPETASPDEVRAAWKRKAIETHPDKGGKMEDFHAARVAFAEALRIAENAPCAECIGTGRREERFGFYTMPMRCDACRGTGKAYPPEENSNV